EPRMRIATAEQAAEFLLPGRGAGRELADFLLVPARPADFRGVRALPRGGNHPSVDVEEVAVGVKAELALDPASALGRNVFVPDRRWLDDVAVAVEHGEVLAHGSLLSVDLDQRRIDLAKEARLHVGSGLGRAAKKSDAVQELRLRVHGVQ